VKIVAQVCYESVDEARWVDPRTDKKLNESMQAGAFGRSRSCIWMRRLWSIWQLRHVPKRIMSTCAEFSANRLHGQKGGLTLPIQAMLKHLGETIAEVTHGDVVEAIWVSRGEW